MSAPSPGSAAQPRRSALRADGDSPRTSPLSAPVKAVQIAEPESASPDESQVKKQFSAGIAKRLSGRPPVSAAPSRPSTLSLVSMEGGGDPATMASSASAEEAQPQQPTPHHRHRLDRVTERLLSQVADWLEREKDKRKHGKSRKLTSRRKSPPSTEAPLAPSPGRSRADSLESNSSEVSLDRLQRILDDSMSALGLNNVPSLSPQLGRKHRKRSSRTLSRAASSDTEWFDGDVVVPGCDAFLDNSKTLSYTGGHAAANDSTSTLGRREEKERQNWVSFKNEIIRLAHTLRLKGWRRVPLDSGESIAVERLSGALTNAVYVVSPPSELLLPREAGKKQPTKVLLRIYGPQVEHLIDRENELGVLRRLARKKIGPRLLGTFLNGRFEQYLNATALTPASMREPETSKQIAKRMRELHEGVELLEEERDQGPGVWKNWDKWLNQVEKTVLYLDKQMLAQSPNLPGGVWKTRGLVCGVPWPVFKMLVYRYRKHLEAYYGDAKKIREKLVFAHSDTQYGNILRVRPDDQKSPLLQPANEHKQLVVIDFEYAAANTCGLEFANHFSEWTYNYHDPVRPFACNESLYPTPEQQRRFVQAYVDHRPKLPYPDSAPSPFLSPTATPALTPTSAPSSATATASTPPPLHSTPSSTSIVEFMLDARGADVPPGGWREEERRRDEARERRVAELLSETRLWRTANSAQWVAWGIVQAKIPGLALASSSSGGEGRAGAGAGAGEGVGEGVGGEQTVVDAAADGNDALVEDGVVDGRAVVVSDDANNKDGIVDEAVADEEQEFDYLAYAQDRAYFFLGDCVSLGLVSAEELGEEVKGRLKVVDY